jgi:hypothetical protein
MRPPVSGLPSSAAAGFAETMVGQGTRLKVTVEAPGTTHELTVAKLQSWLQGSGKTPGEKAVQVRLRGDDGKGVGADGIPSFR